MKVHFFVATIFAILTAFVVPAFAVDPTGFRDVLISNSEKIGGTGTASASAALEINSITKGLLLPRMTATQRNAISSPATGLMIYDTTFSDVFLYTGAAWVDIDVPPTAIGNTGKFLQSGGGLVPNAWATPGPTTGGTGFTTYTLGDTLYSDASNSLAKLAGNTTAAKNFMTQTGTGTVSAAPAWGAIVGADLPNPSASTLGGVESIAAVSHQWLNSISTSGVPALSQPAFSDVSGTASLTTQVTGTLPIANGGTNNGSLGVDAGGVYYSDGTKLVNLAHGASGTVLTSGGTAAPTWTTVLANPMTTGGDIIYGGSSGVPTRLANGTAGQILQSNGTTLAPSWVTSSSSPVAPTQQSFTSTGTQTGWLFTISTSSTVAVGDTYTNNSNTYTVQGALTATSGQVLFMSGTGATSGTTLTRASGAGTASITFSAKVATATYTSPTPRPLYIKVRLIGGGGGGGGGGTSTATGGTAGNSSFFGPPVLIAGGGGGGGTGSTTVGGNGGAGGTNTLGSFTGFQVTGNAGGAGSCANATAIGEGGPPGAPGPYGGAPTANIATTGGGGAGMGAGGAGGGHSNAGGAPSGGAGGAGGFVEVIISSPAASYPYAIAAAAGSGSGGTSGSAGGAGANGGMIVDEFYQ